MSGARTAVVIGGASGIGRAIATAFAAQGHAVTVADVDAEGAAAVAAEIGAAGAVVDVTDEAGVEALFAAHQGVHAVVNTAGGSTWSPVIAHDVAEWRRIIDLNLVGAFIVLKHAGRAVADGGVLVSLTSLNGRQAGYGVSAYCAAKAGLSMLTQVAAMELGARGVRVNAIAPGLVMTPLTEAMSAVPGVKEDYVENTAVKRAGTPEEIAAAAMFLCSDQASWLTGEVLDINGGAHMYRYPQFEKHLAGLGLGV